MPTYEYACKSCDEHLEVVQSFKDDALTTCPSCGGALRKVFAPIGISFKGSGFYKTDSRTSSSAGKKSTSGTNEKSDSSSSSESGSGSGSGGKSESSSSSPSSSSSSSSSAAAS